MSIASAFDELTKLVKSLSNDDNVWLIHLMNKDEIEYKHNQRIYSLSDELIEEDIQSLNSMHNIGEVKNIVLNKFKNYKDSEINQLIRLIEEHKESLHFRSHDFSKYKEDPRLLNFILFKILDDDKFDEFNVREIQNNYLRFIYIIFVLNSSDSFYRKLERSEKEFSNILIEKSLHFKNYDNICFYKWALKYIQDNRQLSRRFHLNQYSPIQDAEFKVTILSVFDQIYVTDLNAYSVLKDKISNAWYQKTYRKKNKGKKHYYFFTEKTQKCLQIIAKKNNIKEDEVLENLINEYYAKHFVNHKGEAIYTLNT